MSNMTLTPAAALAERVLEVTRKLAAGGVNIVAPGLTSHCKNVLSKEVVPKSVYVIRGRTLESGIRKWIEWNQV